MLSQLALLSAQVLTLELVPPGYLAPGMSAEVKVTFKPKVGSGL